MTTAPPFEARTAILGLDPGSKSCGFALVEVVGPTRVRFIRGGAFSCESSGPFLALLGECSLRVHQLSVAIENPEGFIYETFRGPTVIKTAHAAGGMSWAAAALGFGVLELPAKSVRTALFGKARVGGKTPKKGDMDRALAQLLPAFVEGFPAKSNPHVRDGLAITVVGARHLAANKKRGRP